MRLKCNYGSYPVSVGVNIAISLLLASGRQFLLFLLLILLLLLFENGFLFEDDFRVRIGELAVVGLAVRLHQL